MDNKKDGEISSSINKRITNTNQFTIGPRGFIFFLLALLVLGMGFIGFLEYERLVKPFLKIFICCIPAIIIAAILFFFGFATRITTVQNVKFRRRPRSSKNGADNVTPGRFRSKPGIQEDLGSSEVEINSGSELRKYIPPTASKTELMSQKENLVNFLKDLDDQHRDKLIMDSTYINLRTKYRHELNDLNTRLKEVGVDKVKKTKVKTKK